MGCYQRQTHWEGEGGFRIERQSGTNYLLAQTYQLRAAFLLRFGEVGIVGLGENFAVAVAILRRVVDATLKDTATMSMCGYPNAVLRDGIVDELVVFRLHFMQRALNDVIAVEILNELDDTTLQGVANRRNLLCGGEEIDHLLHSTRAVHILRNQHQLWSDGLHDGRSLGI